jgi:hypothetical protein
MSVWLLYQMDPSLASIRQLTIEAPPSLAARDLPPGPAGTARPGRAA